MRGCARWLKAEPQKAPRMSRAMSESMSQAHPVPLITIRAEVLLTDPDTCKFTVSQTVHPGGPFFFGGPEPAAGSPLPEQLFGLAGVAHVLRANASKSCVIFGG